MAGDGCRVLGFGWRISGGGFRVSGFGFRVSGFGLRSKGENGPLWAIHLPRHKWPGGLVNEDSGHGRVGGGVAAAEALLAIQHK